jgi:hypothetical protein
MRRRFSRCEFVVKSSSKIGEWELAEFAGHPDPNQDNAGLLTEAGRILAQPY